MVDALVRRLGAREVVRFGGGPQAAHRVVAPDGATHVFAQFGAGLLVPGTRCRIARGMLVDPPALLHEAAALAAVGVPAALTQLTVDPRCRVVTPIQKLVGQMRELARGARRHGSCGRGVGEAVSDAQALGTQAPVFADLLDPARLSAKLGFLRSLKLDHGEQIADAGHGAPGLQERLDAIRRLDVRKLAAEFHGIAAESGLRIEPDEALAGSLRRGDPIVFEGAHGVLLDPDRGFAPHVTATDTTWQPALALITELAPAARPFRLGVLRAYATRHGAGPFPTEDATLALPDSANTANDWQGPLRLGWPDLLLARYAAAVCGGLDGLAVTCLDRAPALAPLRAAVAYRLASPAPRLFDTTPEDPLHAVAIRVTPQPDAALTGALGSVQPLWRDVGSAEALVGLLASRDGLGVPVIAACHGETAPETAWRSFP